MSIIRFTESDKLAGKVLEKGAYAAQISEIENPTASKSQKSVHYYTTFRVIEGPYMNKELRVSFNSETNNASLLGDMQFFPVRDYAKVLAAVKGIKYDDIPAGDIDLDMLVNQPLDIMVDVETSGGNLVNKITAFMPKGKGVGQKAPF